MENPKAFLLAALFSLAPLAAGCSALRLELVDASVEKPSNVAVYFTVDTRQGEPVPGLTADQFNIYEDGRLVSTHESRQTILNPEVAAVRYTLLLLDMSGSVVEAGQVPLIQEAVGAFLQNVDEKEKVAIYAFDGRAEIQEIAGFDSAAASLSGRAERLSSWKTEDPSTNLNGAIIEAVSALQQARDESELPLRFGNLVVFTDGTDRAARATAGEALRAARDAEIGLYAIGLGGEVDPEEIRRLGRDGSVHVSENDAVVAAFEQIAEKIQGLASRFYLLSYCSPARAGAHELEVEAVRGEEKGSLSYEFDAEGFEPGCDPSTPPAFDMPGTELSGKKGARRRAARRAKKPKSAPAAEGGSKSKEIAPPPAY